MGLEKIATYTKMNNHDLMIDAGDLIQGLAINTLDKGKTAQDLANYIGYDVRGIGNHEFDWGIDNLITLSQSSKAPMLSNNIVFSKDYTYKGTDNKEITYKTGDQLFPSYEIQTLHDGTKVGLIGVSTPETVNKTNPINVEMLKFENPIEKTKESVKELQDKGIDLIFAVSHLGVAETSEFTSQKLAEQVDGLDLIIDGHSHTTLESGIEVKKPNQPNSTWIAQTGSYSVNLGEIDFKLSDDKKALKDVNVHLLNYNSDEIKNIDADDGAKKITQPLKDEWKVESEKVAFKNPYDLIANSENGESKIEETRLRETNMGDIYADALVYDYNKQKESENKQADFSIINGGSFRANIPAGDVTNGQVSDTSPFGNTLQAVELSPNEVIELFNISIETNYGQGGFLQVSNGVQVSYDKTNRKLVSLTINGTELYKDSKPVENLDTNLKFTVVINDYLGNGGDNYKLLGEGKTKEEVSGTIDLSFKTYGEYLASKVTSKAKPDMTTMTFDNYKESFPTTRISFIDSTKS